jgi:Zinc finger, C2H2 type/C2H2-type zinc finger
MLLLTQMGRSFNNSNPRTSVPYSGVRVKHAEAYADVEEAYDRYMAELGEEAVENDSSSESSEEDNSDLTEWMEISKNMPFLSDSEDSFIMSPRRVPSTPEKLKTSVSSLEACQPSTSNVLPKSTMKRKLRPKQIETPRPKVPAIVTLPRPQTKRCVKQQPMVRKNTPEFQYAENTESLTVQRGFAYTTPSENNQKAPSSCGASSSTLEPREGSAKLSNAFGVEITCKFPQCQRSFKSAKALKIHMKVHEDKNRIYVCSICTLRFQNYKNLKIHYTKVHKGIPVIH